MYEQHEGFAGRYDEAGYELPFASWREGISGASEGLDFTSAEDFFTEVEAETAGEGPGRLVIASLPLLAAHRGNRPDLILKWNQLNGASNVDVVVHFHGFSGAGQGPNLRIDRDKEPWSGLDFANPKDPTSVRTRPTVAFLPRGNYRDDAKKRAFNFPALTGSGALSALIAAGLTELGAKLGRQLCMARLIVTGHSGGGSPVNALLANNDPDEVVVFDGLYAPAPNIAAWAKRKIAHAAANPGMPPPSLRIIHGPGTRPDSETISKAIAPSLARPEAQGLRRYFRVEATAVDHGAIAKAYGWRFLLDPGADMPKMKSSDVPQANESLQLNLTHEMEEQFDGEQQAEEFETDGFAEDMAWLDMENEISEAENFEQEGSEFEGARAWDAETEEFEAEAFEGEGEEHEAQDFVAEVESMEHFTETEDFAGGRYDEAGEAELFETEQPPAMGEWEEEVPVIDHRLTAAENRALAITSTLETGKAGSFFGLTGNFDGQGISFGLVNWTMGTGSLQVLLRDFHRENQSRWNSVFGPDAQTFAALILPSDKAAKAAQHRFSIEQMNETSKSGSKVSWKVKQPWLGYFRALSEDSAFQQIQLRHVRNMMNRAANHCRSYGLASEAGFCFMFDTVSSHGGSWPGKKNREALVQAKLQAIPGARSDSDVMLVIADVLADTSLPRWAEMVRERKKWFVTGEHRRGREINMYRPSLTKPYVKGGPAPQPQPAVNPPQPVPAAKQAALSALGQLIANMARVEYAAWHGAAGALQETDAAAVPLLQKYYSEGIKTNISAKQIRDAAWQREHPWSAVFISFVMRKIAPRLGFRFSAAHRVYISAAKHARQNNESGTAFWAFRIAELAPQVGDVVCKWRAVKGKKQTPATYDNIDNGAAYNTHGDIVVEVGPGYIKAIGGNVNQNVDIKTIKTGADGKILLTDDAQKHYFAIVSWRGADSMAAPPATPSSKARTPSTPEAPRSVCGASPGATVPESKGGAAPSTVPLAQKLVQLGLDPESCTRIRNKAFQAMTRIYGKPTAHNACACTLSMFLKAAGLDIKVEYRAHKLAQLLEQQHGWQRIAVGQQKPGDVAVTFPRDNPNLANHVFFVVKTFDVDRMLIVDNQTASCTHERYASGKGRTPVRYFLRAPNNGRDIVQSAASPKIDVVDHDQDTNHLVERFELFDAFENT